MSFNPTTDIFPVRALRDNYIWMICNSDYQIAWAVDPGESGPVLQFLKEKRLTLAGILITHHHPDHTGGIQDLLKIYPNIQIVGSKDSRISHVTQKLSEGEKIVSEFFNFEVIEIPGHTLDHIAFYGHGVLFCGDTLFSAGCGRVFEGTIEMMYSTLNKIASLDEAVQIYCGHEYTLHNLKFAQMVEGNNLNITNKIASINEALKASALICTLPSTLREEKLFNPFLRCDIPAVVASAEQHCGKKLNQAVDVFGVLRQWKNHF
ncbi:MAG: hydroxyacylglutathione hydrolase [Gammaproteobacteria bacterium]|nr:hydroxyacylglutathione hydrolase [Gammaproteobacteria bacterium]